MNKLIKLLLERQSNSVIDWFKNIDMRVNPDKFQAMILSYGKKENKYPACNYMLKVNNRQTRARCEIC